MRIIEKIAEARRIRYCIYLALILATLIYRAYEGDREGMALCMLVVPMALIGIVNS